MDGKLRQRKNSNYVLGMGRVFFANFLNNSQTDIVPLLLRIVPFIASLKNASNGYGGGPRQLAHLLPTYASVASLINVGTEESFQSIDR